MLKSVLFYVCAVAITLIFAYTLVTHEDHSGFIAEKKSRQVQELPNVFERDFWNFLAQPR